MKGVFSVLFFVCLAPAAFGQKTSEERSIVRVLEQESATWRSGDVKAHAALWRVQPYSRILVSTPEGKTYDVPPAAILNPDPKDMDLGGRSVNSNYHIKIYGNYAWVSHDEESTSKEGKKSYSHEMRMLEKWKGQWKLVGQSIHLYNQ